MAVSRKLFAFRASEIETVRVICKSSGCGVVTELPFEQLTMRFSGDSAVCPHCRSVLCVTAQRRSMTPLEMVAVLAYTAKQGDAKFDVEFIVPDAG